MKRQPVVASSAASTGSPSKRRRKAPKALPLRGTNAAPPDLAGVGVERVEGDLLAVHV
jgi:hypothetical protein